jgi:tetratricopeptide (TPR) repeat protein
VLAFAILWYLATLVFVLQWLPVGQAITADRYTYLPYIGPAFALGWALDRLYARGGAARSAAAAAALAFALLLAVQARAQVAVWRDDVTLWSRAIAQHPTADLAYVWRGNAYATLGRMDEARRDLETARRLGNRSAPLWTGLGTVYGSTGHADSALVMFDRSLAIAPGAGRTYYDRGVALTLLGRRDEALHDFTRALALAPGMAPQVLGARGAVKEGQGDWSGASADFEAAMAAGARGPLLLYAHAIARLRLRDTTTARAELREAIRLDPRSKTPRTLLDSLGAGPAELRPARLQ